MEGIGEKKLYFPLLKGEVSQLILSLIVAMPGHENSQSECVYYIVSSLNNNTYSNDKYNKLWILIKYYYNVITVSIVPKSLEF